MCVCVWNWINPSRFQTLSVLLRANRNKGGSCLIDSHPRRGWIFTRIIPPLLHPPSRDVFLGFLSRRSLARENLHQGSYLADINTHIHTLIQHHDARISDVFDSLARDENVSWKIEEGERREYLCVLFYFFLSLFLLLLVLQVAEAPLSYTTSIMDRYFTSIASRDIRWERIFVSLVMTCRRLLVNESLWLSIVR